MLVELEKFGGKTSLSNNLLKSLFDFILETLRLEKIISKSWIEKTKLLSQYRNKLLIMKDLLLRKQGQFNIKHLKSSKFYNFLTSKL